MPMCPMKGMNQLETGGEERGGKGRRMKGEEGWRGRMKGEGGGEEDVGKVMWEVEEGEEEEGKGRGRMWKGDGEEGEKEEG